MYKIFTFFFINVFFFLNCSAQNVKDTVFQVGGRSGDYIYAAKMDKNGNIIIAGDFSSSNLYVKDSTNGLKAVLPSDIFLMKLDKNGNIIWEKAFTNQGNATVGRICIDVMGNIYIGGNFYNGLSLDGKSVSGSSGIGYPYIAKIDSSGNAVWMKSYTTWIGASSVAYINTDSSGNVYASFYYVDSIEAEGITFKSATPAIDGLVIKYDSTGKYLWGDKANFVSSICLDNNGHIYLSGLVNKGSLQWGNANVQRNDVNAGAFLSKIKDDGSMIWFKSWPGGNSSYFPYTNMGPNGNIYAAGVFNDSLALPGHTLKTVGQQPNDVDIIMLSFDTSGNILWYKTYGSVGLDYVEAANIDNYGNFYASGNFEAPLPVGTDTLKSHNQDIYIVKLDKNGNLLKSMQTEAMDPFSQIDASSLNFNKQNQLYVTGYFNDETAFGDSELITRDYEDGFIWKVSPSFTTAGINNNALMAEQKIGLSLYPNPTNSGNVVLRSTVPVLSVRFFDCQGKRVYQSPYISNSQSLVNTYPIYSLIPGIYMVQAITNKGIGTLKFIKDR